MEKANIKIYNELKDLFDMVPPAQLKKSIYRIFSKYLQTIGNETDLDEFKLLAEDIYFLYIFLEKVEERRNE